MMVPDYVVNVYKAQWWIFFHWILPLILPVVFGIFVWLFIEAWYENKEDKEEDNLSILHNVEKEKE